MNKADLPPGWAWARLGELLREPLVNGRSVKTMEGGFPVLRLTALKADGIDVSEHKPGAWKESEAVPYILAKGDFLISRGNGSLRLVGRGSLVRDTPFPTAFPDTMIRVRARPEAIALGYLGLIWNAPLVRRQIEAAARTTAGIYKINQGILEHISLPLPPLPEQHRIVESLESHLSRLDQADHLLAASKARVKMLLPRILSSSIFREQGPLVRLDKIAQVRLGRQRSPKNHSGDNMRPYIRAANVTWAGLALDDVKEMNFTDAELEEFRLRRNDIVLSEASGSPGEVGKPAIWRDEIDACCFQNTLIRVRPHGVDPNYLLYFLRCEALRGSFRTGARGVGIHHLGSAKLAAWHVALPSVEKQQRIVSSLDEQLSKLQSASIIFHNSRSTDKLSQQLRASILFLAFSGKLVKQGPQDEPAAVVLERIRAERGAAAEAKRAPRQRRAAPPPPVSTNPVPGNAVQQELEL